MNFDVMVTLVTIGARTSNFKYYSSTYNSLHCGVIFGDFLMNIVVDVFAKDLAVTTVRELRIGYYTYG